MISRVLMACGTCMKPITARIQIGHELEQPVTFPCPHCETEIRLTLILDEPPNVKIRWEENAEVGTEEGKIINVGAGFVIAKDNLHEDKYFPVFDLPRNEQSALLSPNGFAGPQLQDLAVNLGALPQAADTWQTIKKAIRFNRTGQLANLNTQLDAFWGEQRNTESDLGNTIFNFLLRFMEPNGVNWLAPIANSLEQAHSKNPIEFSRLATEYDIEMKTRRFEDYSEIFTDYYRTYGEFNQTLLYTRRCITLPPDAVATSSDFGRTKMYYGSAFEVLGSHLDLPAAINNILCGRPYDQMNAMTLSKFRSLSKASRTRCFADNTELSWLVAEYDSAVRNASHHRWFRLNDSRTQISYRSGGTGAMHHMSYAEYLMRCNQLTIQLMVLACTELVLLSSVGKCL